MISNYTIKELFSECNFMPLVNEYADECAADGVPVARDVKYFVDTYLQLESAGILHALAAKSDDGLLMGFVMVLVTTLPKHTHTTGTCESFFVGKEFRNTGAGLRLLSGAESVAKEHGAVGMLVNAPVDGKLAHVLEHTSYKPSTISYYRGFT
tara:strand:+ start:57 stop:515 length:459 start_codon:yes stop_codon:yes gene_type:complete